ncbi:unnamed protein product [Boreogadus saida]
MVQLVAPGLEVFLRLQRRLTLLRKSKVEVASPKEDSARERDERHHEREESVCESEERVGESEERVDESEEGVDERNHEREESSEQEDTAREKFPNTMVSEIRALLRRKCNNEGYTKVAPQ